MLIARPLVAEVPRCTAGILPSNLKFLVGLFLSQKQGGKVAKMKEIAAT